MPMVRESITTVRSFDIAVNLPVGVGRLGLPIDAGMVRSTSPFLLTVKVCAEMLATPRSPGPVSNTRVPPGTTGPGVAPGSTGPGAAPGSTGPSGSSSAWTPTETRVWGGQYWFGTHCTMLLFVHSKCPGVLLGEVT